MHARALVAAAAAAFVAVPASAGSVDLQIRGKDKVSGTIRPASDEECFLCDLPRGATLTASVKGGKSGPAFRLALKDAGGLEVPGAVFVAKGTGGALQPFVATDSAPLRVCVTTDGNQDSDGDYQASISFTPQTSWQGAGGPLAAAASDTFAFAAPAGAEATIDVVPARGSAFAGSIASVTGPAGFDASGLSGARAVLRGLPATGEYLVSFSNVGADGGWTVKVKLKLAKAKKGKFDLRDGAFAGAFEDDHSVFGRVLDEDGGVVTLPPDLGGAITGTSVSIPAGVLGSPTVVTIAAAAPIGTPAGTQGAGPAVDFGPSGTVFDPTGADPTKQAILTLPYDPAAFPGGTDSLRVYVRDEEGDVVLVPPPYTIDAVAFTVTFAVSHFSTYQAASEGPRRLTGSFVVLEPFGDADSNFSGALGAGLHQLYANGATADFSSDEAAVRWTNVAGQGVFVNLNQQFDSAQYDLSFNGDEIVQLTAVGDTVPAATLLRGPSDDVLIGQDVNVVALRRAEGYATRATLAGKWHVFRYGFETETRLQQQGPPIVSFILSGDTGALVLDDDGTVDFANLRSVEAMTTYPDGAWTSETRSQPPQGLTWDVGEGGVFIRSPEDQPPIQLTPCVRGDVLVGRVTRFGSVSEGPGPAVEVFVLVRATSGLAGEDVAGGYFVTEHDIQTVDRPSPPPGQGLRFRDASLDASLARTGRISLSGAETVYEHDAAGEPIPPVRVTVPPFESRISIRSDGSFSGDGNAAGAFVGKGALLVRMGLAGDAIDLDFGTKRLPVTAK